MGDLTGSDAINYTFLNDSYNHTIGSSSNTQNETLIKYFAFLDVMKWLSFTLLTGIVAINTLLIILLAIKKKKSRMVFFVINLAVADLGVGLFYVLPETIFNWFRLPWTKEWCYYYYGYFNAVFYYASTFSITILTIDRLIAIKRPLATVTKGKKYRYGLLLSAWMFALLVGIIYAVNVNRKDLCEYNFNGVHKKAIAFFEVSVLMLIPLIIMVVCYTVIVITIWRRGKRGFIVDRKRDEDDECRAQHKDRIITKAKIRTVQLLFIVVIAYITCWTPYLVCVVLDNYEIIDERYYSDNVLKKSIYLLAPLNSLVNPLVFLLFNWNLFCENSSCCKLKNNSRNSSDGTNSKPGTLIVRLTTNSKD